MQPQEQLNAIIVDDEYSAIENLRKLLKAYCPAIHVIESASGAESAAEMINRLKPEVVFLDIAMPRKNGFELINMLTFIPLIVFVTAHEKFAINAIKAAAVDYLLKPVDINELQKVEQKLLQIQYARANTSFESYNANIASFLQMLHNPGSIKRISLPDARGYNIVNTEQILYLEGENNYTTFYLDKNQKIVVSRTLKEYEDLLDEALFIRIHKSFIVNMLHLKNISKDNGLSVVMDDGKVLQVSRRRSNEILDRVKKDIR